MRIFFILNILEAKSDKFIVKMTPVYLLFCSFIITFLNACTLDSSVQDIPVGGISFKSFSEPLYSNKASHDFDFSIDLKGVRDINQMKVAIYESEDCSGPIVSTDEIDVSTQRAHATGLQDGKKYSFRIQVTALVTDTNKTFQSACTPWVGIDQQNPDPVMPLFPPSNLYVAETKFVAQWDQAVDHGIAGLADKPYVIKLFSQAGCTGTLLRTISTSLLAMEFVGLNQGDFYSYQILAIDRAGNESPISCSPSTEIDIYAPGIKVSNPGSDAGYTSDRNVVTEITNDSWAGYWCLTEDPSFQATGLGDACPGGTGSVNGWSTSRPTSYTVSDGDGLKKIYVGLLDASGVPRTSKLPVAGVTLDRVPPGTFTVKGITGGSDVILNNRLSDDVDPVIHWSASLGARDYNVKILNADLSTRCSGKVEVPDVKGTILNCDLQTEVPYIVRITARDSAGNTTAAPDYVFQKDITPPGAFTIAGVDGGTDTTIDSWSAAHPRVHWSSSTDAVKYWISIREQGTTAPVCSEEEVADPLTSFDFAGTCSPLHSGGVYEVVLRSEDDAGLTTAATNAPFVFRVDLDPPDLEITNRPPALSDSTLASFEFNVNDALSGLSSVECRWNAGPFAACTSPVSLSSLSEGNHSFDIKAIDKVGNVVNAHETFAVDLSDPVVTFTLVPALFSSSANAHFEFTAVDVGPAGLDRIECQLDGASWVHCFSPLDHVSLSEGSHQLKVRAADRLGHESLEAVHNWFIDSTAPIVTLTSTPTDGLTATTASVSFTAIDGETALTAVECQWNGGAWTACSSPNSRSGLPVGLNNFKVRATNQAGLATEQSYSWQIYSYSWYTTGWGACDAAQPSWQTSGWGGCDAAQPAWQAGGWGACNVSCGAGTQWRSVSCPVNNGNQWRSVSCPTNSGNQWRTVECHRNDGVSVDDAYCGGGKPAVNLACSRNDCAGAAPAANLACSRGGGSDCHSMPSTAQACDMGSCSGTWQHATWGATSGNSCGGIAFYGATCSPVGFYCDQYHNGIGMETLVCQ